MCFGPDVYKEGFIMIIKMSDLSSYIGKFIYIEYLKNEYVSGDLIINEWLKNKVKLIKHNEIDKIISFEDSSGKRFDWEYSKFKSIESAE